MSTLLSIFFFKFEVESHCCLGWLGTYFVPQAGLEFTMIPYSASQVLDYKSELAHYLHLIFLFYQPFLFSSLSFLSAVSLFPSLLFSPSRPPFWGVGKDTHDTVHARQALFLNHAVNPNTYVADFSSSYFIMSLTLKTL